MAIKYIAGSATESVTGTVTTEPSKFTTNQVVVGISGTFTSVTFEDRKYGINWASVLNANDGSVISVSEATNELAFFGPAVCGLEIRATITDGVDVKIWYDEGVGGGIA